MIRLINTIVRRLQKLWAKTKNWSQSPSTAMCTSWVWGMRWVRLLLTGTKISCDDGACGCCTVIMNGKAIPSCTVLTIECDGADIRTIEGLQDPNTGELDKVQQAFVDHSAFQCGYCTPGIIMTTEALLAENPHPDEEEIKEALAGNYCRCISHYQVLEAVKQAAKEGSE